MYMLNQSVLLCLSVVGWAAAFGRVCYGRLHCTSLLLRFFNLFLGGVAAYGSISQSRSGYIYHMMHGMHMHSGIYVSDFVMPPF